MPDSVYLATFKKHIHIVFISALLRFLLNVFIGGLNMAKEFAFLTAFMAIAADIAILFYSMV